jgi:type IV secretory pathway protease TraF
MANLPYAKLLILLAASTAVVLAFTTSPRLQDLALYNHSPSLPVGLYLRVTGPLAPTALGPGAIVTVRARDVAPATAAARSFAGDGHRFIKRVAAVAGDHVCAKEGVLRVNGAGAWPVRSHDRAGAPLWSWVGCRRLAAGQVLLLGDTPDSFDGRYWGPIDAGLIEGVWRKL